jgi:hypothetical protein
MRHRLATKAGRARYALRKQTVEPVFGISESVLGFRRFLMRGLDKVQIEWTLVCLAWNLERMAVLRPQCTAALVPGLMLSAACVACVYVRCRLDPSRRSASTGSRGSHAADGQAAPVAIPGAAAAGGAAGAGHDLTRTFHQVGPENELRTHAHWVCSKLAIGTIWFAGLHGRWRAPCGQSRASRHQAPLLAWSTMHGLPRNAPRHHPVT